MEVPQNDGGRTGPHDLIIRGLAAGYGGHAILTDLDVHAPAGRVTALIGPNGCGKTTLIRTIAGSVPPIAGSCQLGDVRLESLRPPDRARKVAVVPQGIDLPDSFTAGEIVMLGRTPYLPRWGRPSLLDRQACASAMAAVDVAQLADRRADELSGGERQRVVFARALAQEPVLLLLDEPTAHLDLRHQVSTFSIARALTRNLGMTVLAAVHDLSLAAACADHVVLLANGGVAAAGTVQEVLRPEPLAAAYGTRVDVLERTDGRPPVVAPVFDLQP